MDCNKYTIYIVYVLGVKVRKRATIRNRYNQTPHLTQDTNGKVTTSQLDITNECQEVSPFPAGDHKTSINRRARKHTKTKNNINNINDSQKKHRPGTVTHYWRAKTGLTAHQPPALPRCGSRQIDAWFA